MNVFEWLMLRKKKPEHSEQYLQLRKAYYDMQNTPQLSKIQKFLRDIMHNGSVIIEGLYHYQTAYLYLLGGGAYEYTYRVNKKVTMCIVFNNQHYAVLFIPFEKNVPVFDQNSTIGLRLRRIIDATHKKLHANNPEEAMAAFANPRNRYEYKEKIKRVENHPNLDRQR